MADIKLNFSSQWPSIQVAKVIQNPATVGETAIYPYITKIPHGLGYPPLCIGFRNNQSSKSNSAPMEGVDVDENYIYIDDFVSSSQVVFSYVVVYALDISQPFSYKNYTSEVGDVVDDTSGGTLDLRKFLLHSRAVSPMVLSVTTKDYTLSDLTLTYTHPLSYPIFNFGYIRNSWKDPNTTAGTPIGVWRNAPLASQAWPWLNTDGYTSTLGSTTINNQLAGDKGSIITLRNPAIITNNSVSVTL